MAEAGEKLTTVEENPVVKPTQAAVETVTESKPAKAAESTPAVAKAAELEAKPAPEVKAADAPAPKKRGRPAKPKTEASPPAAKTVSKRAKPARKPAAKRTPSKTAAAKPAVKAAPVKAASVKAPAKRTYTPRKTAAPASKITLNKIAPINLLKESPMAKNAPEITAAVSDALKDITGKAKAAYEKGTAMVGDYSEFAKGNVEAVVESTKILASGVQELGRDYVAESKSAFEAITADVKDLAAVKTPSEFFQLQTALMKKSFDTAVAFGSKNSEQMLKLTNEAFAPLSNRVSLAMEKAKLAA